MQYQYSPYILPLAAAAVVSGWVFFYAWPRRATAAAASLAGMALVITVWLVGYALEIAGATLSIKLLFAKMQYIGIVLAPLAWFIFAFNHTNQAQTLPLRPAALLAVVPLLTLVIAFTTEAHGLLWSQYGILQSGNFSALKVTYGPWFWVHSIYSYVLLLAGTGLIIRSIVRDQGLYRAQAAALLVGVLAPWIANIIYLAGLSPLPHLDLTPFAFTLTVAAIAWGIFGFRLIDLTPIARASVVEEMQDAMVVIDTRGRVADLNRQALALAGLPAAQVIGLPAAQVFARWQPIASPDPGALLSTHEVNIGSVDHPSWYELLISPLHDRRKRLMGQVVIVRDINQRKHTEQRIAQLSRAVEASPASIVVTDTQGRIEYVNPKFTQVTGYTLEEVLGQNPRILKTDQTSLDTHVQMWQTILQGQEWRGEFCNRKKNGDLYWEWASISPITGTNGEITHFVAVKEDITERKLAEKKLASAHEKALQASLLKSQLLAKVSHELRTPLGSILGYAELLQRERLGPLAENQKQAAAQIIESSRYLETMVNELLDEAQIESRTITLHVRPFSPAAILRRVETSLSVLCRNKGLGFESSIDPDLPQELHGDEHRLQQILLNLAGNAIKFTKNGSVSVRLFQPDPSHWALQVADTGLGIPPEARSVIFEPFHQLNDAITHENRGTGLGLSITKHLVEYMGGSIQLDSEVGKGSTFTVLLPLLTNTEKIA